MAKLSMVQRDKKRKVLAARFAKKRAKIKAKIMDKKTSMEERFGLQLQLNDLPRDSSQSRQRNRCGVTGRPRGYYRKFKMSRIALRELALRGQLPGVTKSSW
jgi:small subunit ribosomal protein S14